VRVRSDSRERRACGRSGHLTYAPTEPEFAARLRAHTALGEAWRCLRCGDWALGPPGGSGPADRAPVPARGKALRQLALLRLLAVERGIRAVVLVVAAYGVKRFASAQTSLRRSFHDALPAARPLADRLGVDLDHSLLVREATKALDTSQTTLTWVALGLLGYGVLEGVEAVGLWLARRWAEYLTVVATAAFLPLEVYELAEHTTATKIGAFALNIAVVVYLVLAKRLFGARGGAAEHHRQMRSESLLEVTAAATAADLAAAPHGSGRDVGMGG
jgi:uncharacterized membrane protein (DUF2068 family)